jgi:transglutaminase-like putative cysteine protease
MTTTHDQDLLRSLRRLDGWFTIGLVALVCATLAWSLDDALLVLGRDEYTDFLFWAAMGGVAAGLAGPLAGWGRWTTHLIGAAFAALLVPLLVGSVLQQAGASAAPLFQATTDQTVEAWFDLIVDGRPYTRAFGHHLLILGFLAWGTSQFASYATFGHRRPINAVVVVGLFLLANMALTTRPQLVYLVIFSIASLFLLVRFHTLDEQADWLRRRIGDPTAISALYLRGGTVFIIAAISGALLLTQAASSAPLAGAWTDIGARVVQWGQFLERFLPAARSGRPLGPSFGATALIRGQWSVDQTPQLEVQFPAGEKFPPFLAAAYYDRFDLQGWSWTNGRDEDRAAGAELLVGTGDQLVTQGRRQIATTITPLYPSSEVFLPGAPSKVDGPTRVRLFGEGSFLSGISRDWGGGPYTVTSWVPAATDAAGLTEARLRGAGTVYPPEIERMYGSGALPAGAMGPQSQQLLDEIVGRVGANGTPYDLANEIVETLHDPDRFPYSTDVTDQLADCPNGSWVECFAIIRSGFCQWYATTMTVFLRERGVPARYVEGYLQGEPDPSGSGTRTVRSSDGHAWVQVYFPNFGWVDFDPTGSPDREAPPRLEPIPSGQPLASGSPRPSNSGSIIPGIPTIPPDERDGVGGSVSPRPRGPGAGLFIAIAILLTVVVGSIAAVAYRRGPRGPISPDDAYGSISRLAKRLGFGPRPTQTVYEYAGALADELPMVRPELETVARAKVEVAYGARSLPDERMAALRHAHRRLRVQLLRLIPRRRRRRSIWRR